MIIKQGHDICLYFKVFGLGQDKKGNPCFAGMKISIGHAKKDTPYSELKNKLMAIHNWKNQILELTHLSTAGIKPKDIDVITPEEYDKDYGDDDDE